jgi:glutathione S-transferase
MKFYYCVGSASFAPHVVLFECGCDFETVHVSVKDGSTRSPEFLLINPKGRVPVLDTGTEVLTESAAIMYYVALSHSEKGLTADTPMGMARTIEWTNWLSTIHAANLAQKTRPERFTNDEFAFDGIRAKGIENLNEMYSQINDRLAGNDWAVPGGVTVADAHILQFFKWGHFLGLDMDQFQHWCAHTRRMEQRPSVQKVLEAEGSSLWK